MNNVNWGEAQIYDWKDRQGRNIKGVLIKPPYFVPGKRYPLVIEARLASQDRFAIDGQYSTATAARAMAADDLLVLQASELVIPNSEFIQDSEQASLAAYEAVVDKLSNEGMIDSNRVGIIGFSRTCSNALYALTRTPNLFAAATIANGNVYGFMQYLNLLDKDPRNIGVGQYIYQI
jgi:predicted peptidase